MRRHPSMRRPGAAAAALLVITSPGATPHPVSTDEARVVVTGTVTGGGRPLQRASVFSADARAGVGTGADGRYTLTLTAERGDTIELRARAIGFEQATRHVAVRADTIVADFVLQPATVRLSEVVVTGAAVDPQTSSVPFTAARAPGLTLRGTSAIAAGAPAPQTARTYGPPDTEEYGTIDENPFVAVAAHPLSTFSIDVDRASYANVRRFLLAQSQLPPRDAVRVEEMVNYFPYDYARPTGPDPIAVSTEVARAPWAPDHRLVRIALSTRPVELDALPSSNLVFLLDVSGSMAAPNKLPLLRRSLRLLVDGLRPKDRVAIVVYAGAAGLVLPSTPASERTRILDAIERLEAGGSTAGGAGIRLAYDVARRSFLHGGNNRVILATDGDFNVGVSSTSELVRLVEERRREGTYLTVLGFGMGNLKDERLEQLADRGNGNYAYIDDLLEARKVLVHEMGGTLVTVAKDVKLQVEFNPRLVRAYRLIGYENRLLAEEDFADDTKDAGEIGAGHAVTALYEVVPVGVATPAGLRESPPLRYRGPRSPATRAESDELLAVSVRYKPPASDRSRLLRHVVRDVVARPSGDFAFASAVAGFGMLLRDSEYAGNLTYAAVRELAASAVGDDPDGYRAGFLALVDAAERLDRRTATAADGARRRH
ncbi:MAG TPA: von Willebrand factor type A domain-containing protein [Gemmatimonadaceae bacterium]|nr:von Willebrand factor type A domain-containing protein [Gemmatimonadaceae bacterium]